jgi:uncharacterized protein YbjT (DUF2867 family)
MRCLILGGTGLIGKALANKLQENGHDINIVARKPASKEFVTLLPKAKWFVGDLGNESLIREALKNIDVIFQALMWNPIY